MHGHHFRCTQNPFLSGAKTFVRVDKALVDVDKALVRKDKAPVQADKAFVRHAQALSGRTRPRARRAKPLGEAVQRVDASCPGLGEAAQAPSPGGKGLFPSGEVIR